jgi:hypothetical protein
MIAGLCFIVIFELASHYAAQAGLKLLGSSDPAPSSLLTS